MENGQLTQDLIEKWGEETQIGKIIETSLQLSLSLQKFSQIKKKEDHVKWNESYNDVCGRIAEMRIMTEQCEFMFNKNEINNHHDLFMKSLEKELTQY
jgi:hypothetical protein